MAVLAPAYRPRRPPDTVLHRVVREHLPTEMLSVIRKVRAQVDKALARTEPAADAGEQALDRCAQLALFRGDARQLDDASDDAGDPRAPERACDGKAVTGSGYNLDASVRIDGSDDFGREHLLRYCLRPPLALGRLTRLPGVAEPRCVC